MSQCDRSESAGDREETRIRSQSSALYSKAHKRTLTHKQHVTGWPCASHTERVFSLAVTSHKSLKTGYCFHLKNPCMCALDAKPENKNVRIQLWKYLDSTTYYAAVFWSKAFPCFVSIYTLYPIMSKQNPDLMISPFGRGRLLVTLCIIILHSLWSFTAFHKHVHVTLDQHHVWRRLFVIHKIVE